MKVYRSLMVAGLLLGLFISSGEGVRLFPIPVNSEAGSNTRAPEAKRSASGRYNIGVRQTRTNGFAKIKVTKRPLADSPATVSQNGFDASTVFYLSSLQIASSDPIELKLDTIAVLYPGRAPPLS